MFVLLLPFSIPVVYAWCTGPVPMWRCRGHISHFAQLPRGISPTRCLLGPTAGELLPKIHHPAFLPLPHHATHPPTPGLRGIKSTISASSLCNGDLPQSEARKSAHECTVAARKAINWRGGGGKPYAGHPTSQSYLMALERSLPDLLSYNLWLQSANAYLKHRLI